MSHNATLKLALNGGAFARRWESPDSWMRLTREAGFACHEFSTDLVDPLLSGDEEFCAAQAQAVSAAAKAHEVSLTGVWAGSGLGRLHGLCHSDPIPRQRAIEWIVGCMDMAVAMGAAAVGGRFGVVPTEVMQQGEHGQAQAVRRLHEIMREIAQIGGDKGLTALWLEQGCIPAEVPWTIRQAEEFLIEMNRKGDGCPVYLGLDAGRMGRLEHGREARDADVQEWLRALGPFAQVIRLPRAMAGGAGLEELLAALLAGHEHARENWVSEVLPVAPRHWLVLDLRGPDEQPDGELLESLQAAAQSLGRFLPGGELELTA
jgi:sugar phosphate isomerase/epimerase